MIKELMNKHQDKKFVSAEGLPSKGIEIPSVEEFLQLDDTFLYEEELLEEEEATAEAIDNCVLAAQKLLESSFEIHHREYSATKNFMDDYVEEHREDLQKRCAVKEAQFLTLKCLHFECLCHLENFPIEESIIESVSQEIASATLADLLSQAEESENELQEMKDVVLSVKSDFTAATTQVAKNKIINQMLLKLKDTYPDSHHLGYFTKDRVLYMLESD